MVEFENDALIWGKKKIVPAKRDFASMRPVLAYPENEGDMAPDVSTYFMYREAERFSSIRYDVTRIPALDLCGELNKTFGHVHPKNIRGTGWPEAYEVLEGTAHFLMQKVGQLGVDDAILLLVKKGEAFLVPPNYGHITINAGKGDLVMGNLVSDRFQSDYSMFAQRRGGCYYETTEGKLVRNRNYGSGFELRQMGAREFSDAFGRYPPFSNGLLPAAKDYDNIEFLEKPELFY